MPGRLSTRRWGRREFVCAPVAVLSALQRVAAGMPGPHTPPQNAELASSGSTAQVSATTRRTRRVVHRGARRVCDVVAVCLALSLVPSLSTLLPIGTHKAAADPQGTVTFVFTGQVQS